MTPEQLLMARLEPALKTLIPNLKARFPSVSSKVAGKILSEAILDVARDPTAGPEALMRRIVSEFERAAGS